MSKLHYRFLITRKLGLGKKDKSDLQSKYKEYVNQLKLTKMKKTKGIIDRRKFVRQTLTGAGGLILAPTILSWK